MNGDAVIHVVESAYKIDGKGGRPIETEPWSHNQPSIIFFWPGSLAFLGPEVVISGRGKNVEERASSATGPHQPGFFWQIDMLDPLIPMAKNATFFWGISTIGQARAAFAVRIIWGARVPGVASWSSRERVNVSRKKPAHLEIYWILPMSETILTFWQCWLNTENPKGAKRFSKF